MEAFVDGLPGFAAIVGAKGPRGGDCDVHALRIALVENDGVEAHAAGAGLPFRAGTVAAEAGEFLPGLAAVFRAENGGVFDACVNGVRLGERRLEVPDALKLPGMLRAVVKLMRGERRASFGGSVVDEFVAFAFRHAARAGDGLAWRRARLDPSFAAVIGALNNLAEPSAGLRGVNAVRIFGRALHVVTLPAGKMGAANVPFFTLAV